MRVACLAYLSIVLVSSCDAPPARDEAATPAHQADGTPAGVKMPRTRTEAEVADCVATCDRDSATSDTDRATCRLNCRGDVEQPADLVSKAVACLEGCTDERSATDRSTCELSCTTAPSAERAQRDCDRACLQALAHCVAGCEREVGTSTDAATCRLQCESVARSCVGRCD